ncbi:S-methyl-5-thioribose kinase [Agaribacter flavus]|uniref:S-methyl-5-thioribose kinase n=1 Tax=Agaribacter flavus TaxID=1902781 RepID=A0ABV7FMD6_9ALTE
MTSTAYYTLTEQNIVEYLSTVPAMGMLFDDFSALEVKEVCDGNMNYAFIVRSKNKDKSSVFVKQTPPYIKVLGKDWPLSRERMDVEKQALTYQAQVCPTMSPKLYYSCSAMSVIIMQNLSQHLLLRNALIARQSLPKLASHMSSYLANTLFYSSAFAEGNKYQPTKLSNQAMCQITQAFVFTYPFEGHETNNYNPSLCQNVIDSIQKDPTVRMHIGQMKWAFASKNEALIHGDLHTGSIMVNENDTYIIDPEFAFMGPIGFDIGAFIANLYVNYFAQKHTANPSSESYATSLLSLIETVWLEFETKFLSLWQKHDNHPDNTAFIGDHLGVELAHSDFREWFMQTILSDTMGFAAVKMMRRILGVAKVADVMQFENNEQRAKLEAQILRFAREMLLTRNTHRDFSSLNATHILNNDK